MIMLITCLYENNENIRKKKEFNSLEWFGKWIADNVMEIKIIDVIQEED